MKYPILLVLCGGVLASGALGALGAAEVADYPIRPVPLSAVQITDGFWSPRMETNRVTTVWYDIQKCEETGRIDNFAKAGKLMPGEFRGTPFDDSDVFKVIEGAAYTLAVHPDPKLEKYLDGLIVKIAAAQEPDGYLYTARTIDPKSRVDFFGPTRWSKLAGSHELYNVGHLYEAAVAYYEATGKRSLLNVAIKNADLICKTFGPGKGQLQEPPGHQEIEMGLAKLYRATGQKKYLDQAKYFCDIRGRKGTHQLRGPYQQDHKPISEQDEAVGHAVRAGYFYSGVADVGALTGQQVYIDSVDRLWENVVGKKMHLTGGIGASPQGEAFGANYELPNDTAYLETCAAIANGMWNERMFLLHGDAKYVDVLERVLYNGFLSGVAMSGDKFFYPNPLESDGKEKFNHGSCERAPWFGCSCCPVNDVRFIPEIASFIYATRGKELFVNLFIGSRAKAELDGLPVGIQQETRYPWDGKVLITLTPKKAAKFTVNIRVPGFVMGKPVPGDLYRDADFDPLAGHGVSGLSVKVNGDAFVGGTMNKGYLSLGGKWRPGDTIEVNFPMLVRRIVANPLVAADRDRFAIERGPLVYCAEGADNNGRVLDKIFPAEPKFETQFTTNLLGGMTTIKMTSRNDEASLTCIPYYAWCHRGANEMRVWFPTK